MGIPPCMIRRRFLLSRARASMNCRFSAAIPPKFSLHKNHTDWPRPSGFDIREAFRFTGYYAEALEESDFSGLRKEPNRFSKGVGWLASLADAGGCAHSPSMSLISVRH